MRWGRQQSGGRVDYERAWLRRVLGLIVTLWLLVARSTADAADPAADREALIAALGELKQAVAAKIDSDIWDVAWGLWSVHEIERARFLADLVGAPLVVIEQAIATVGALRQVDDVAAGLTRAPNPLAMTAYSLGLGQLEEAGTRLQMAWDGPAYSSAVRAMYDAVGSAGELQDAVSLVRGRLDAATGPRAMLPVRTPGPALARGAPSFVERPSEVGRLLGQELDDLARDLATAIVAFDQSRLVELTARIEETALAIKRSKSGAVPTPAIVAPSPFTDVTLGAIAGLRNVESELLTAYDRRMKQEMVSVAVKSVKAVGKAALLYWTVNLDGRLTIVQSSVLSVDSLAWGAIERTFPSSVREQLADVPQQMIMALGPELASTWLVAEDAVASVRAEVAWAQATAPAEAAPTQAAAPVPVDELEITMRDGSVLKGQLAAAKLPFVSGYGTIEVATGGLVSFGDGRLALDDGSALKGVFGDTDLELTTGHGALRLPAREIVAIRHGSGSPPAQGPSPAAQTASAGALAQGVLVGRVLDRFNQAVAAATVRIVGSSLSATTDSSGGYQLSYVPGKFRLSIEKDGYDAEQFDLELAQSDKFPVEDKFLTSVPSLAGLYFWGERDWVPLSACRIELAERDNGSSNGGVTRFVALGDARLVVHDGTAHFLDMSGAERIALLPVAPDGTILRMVRQGGLAGLRQAFLTAPGENPELEKVAIPLEGGTIGHERRVSWADLKPGVYAFVTLKADPLLARFSAPIGPPCYIFELKGAAQVEQERQRVEAEERRRAEQEERCTQAPTRACVLDLALATAGSMQDDLYRSVALGKIAASREQAGQHDAARTTLGTALATARGIEAPVLRADTLRQIGAAQVQAGQHAAGLTTLKAALTAARGIERADLRSSVITEIAIVQAESGQSEVALATARGIEDSWRRDETLGRIAAAQADAGQVEAALATARGIETAGPRAGALGKIATAQADAGKIEAALATARGFDDAFLRAEAIGDIAAAQVEAGQIEAALAGVRGIETAGLRAGALGKVAAAQAKAGQLEAALATVRGINDALQRSEALGEIAAAQAKAGQIEAAMATARSIEDASERATVLVEIAPAQAVAGQVEAALATARSSEDVFHGAEALGKIAAAQAAAGQVEAALTTALSIEDAGKGADALVEIEDAGKRVDALVAIAAATSGQQEKSAIASEPTQASEIQQAALTEAHDSGGVAQPVTTPARWLALVDRARIRAAPTPSADVLTTLPAGTILPLATNADPAGEWLAISLDGRDAFVAGRLTRPAEAPPEAIDGAATVSDSATLEVGSTVVRLFGIAGEGGGPAQGMARFVAEQGGRVRCAHKELARYVCRVGERDIAVVALFNGAARVSPDAPESYRKREAQAREARRGIWAQ